MSSKSKGASIGGIAKHFGISSCAVSMALNNSKKVSKETREKVRAYAKEIGYRKDPTFSRIMSNIRSVRGAANETIAIVNASIEPNATDNYPIYAEYVKGIKKEAQRLGFAIYELWLHESGLAEKLRKIFSSRGIRGGIFFAPVGEGSLSSQFTSILEDFTFVSVGLKTSAPVFDFVCADKFLIARHETECLIKDGFCRPGLVLDKHIDDMVEGRFTGGFLSAQLALPESDRIPPFIDVAKAREDKNLFFKWIKKYKPDVLFSVAIHTGNWLQELEGLPDSVKIVVPEKPEVSSEWIGIDENYFEVGIYAVRKLFDLLNRPDYLHDHDIPTTTIIEPHWRTNVNPADRENTK